VLAGHHGGVWVVRCADVEGWFLRSRRGQMESNIYSRRE
jgi:hypothetical protein